MHNSVFIKLLSRLTKFLKCGFGAPTRYESIHPQGALQSISAISGEETGTHPIYTQTHKGQFKVSSQPGVPPLILGKYNLAP